MAHQTTDSKLEDIKMMNLVELAMNKVNAILRDSNMYADDWCWNDDETVIQFEVFKAVKPGMDKSFGTYRFCYDNNDVFDRTAEEQLNDWVEEKIECRFA